MALASVCQNVSARRQLSRKLRRHSLRRDALRASSPSRRWRAQVNVERGQRGLVQQGRVTSVRKVWRELPNERARAADGDAPARVAHPRWTVGGDGGQSHPLAKHRRYACACVFVKNSENSEIIILYLCHAVSARRDAAWTRHGHAIAHRPGHRPAGVGVTAREASAVASDHLEAFGSEEVQLNSLAKARADLPAPTAVLAV